MPGWMMVVWAIGVWGAFLASILLLLRRKLAFAVFVVSLAAFLVSLLYTYVLTDGGPIMGAEMAVTSAVIAILLLFFSWYARVMGKRGVLRQEHWYRKRGVDSRDRPPVAPRPWPRSRV